MIIKVKIREGRNLTAIYKGYKRNIECNDINTLSHIVNNEFLERSIKMNKDMLINLASNNLVGASEFNKRLDRLEKYRLKIIRAIDKSFKTNKETSVTIRV